MRLNAAEIGIVTDDLGHARLSYLSQLLFCECPESNRVLIPVSIASLGLSTNAWKFTHEAQSCLLFGTAETGHSQRLAQRETPSLASQLSPE